MSEVLDGLPNQVCMMDDVLVHAATFEAHTQAQDAVLSRMAASGFTLNPDKCTFACSSVYFLGHIVSKDGIAPDPAKVKALLGMPPCQNVSDIQRFLGLATQLGKFSPTLGTISAPLCILFRKSTAWVWGPDQDAAFLLIKFALSDSTALALYSPDFPTRVSADASSFGLGAVLQQQQPSDDWQPVAFQSRSLFYSKATQCPN